MKRATALLLSLALMLSGCGQKSSERQTAVTANPAVIEEFLPHYDSLDDPDLLEHLEDQVYLDAVTSLNSEDYVVENVSAIYISKEYLEEAAYNSQENIYFGHTLSELDEIFQGKKYIFTLGEDGTTKVEELQEIQDTTTVSMLKNVAIGSGVILVCVTVSVVSAGAGAPAMSMIFAVSAAGAGTKAVSDAAFDGITAGVIRGLETGDFNEAVKAGAMQASESFKWGAISGGITGGLGETFALKVATKNGLKMNEAAKIQKESLLPMNVIKQLHSMDEYKIYKEAGLRPEMVNGKTALLPNINLDYKSFYQDQELTNLQRMRKGLPPIDPKSGKPYQLHHIGQKFKATLAVLTERQHQGNAAILNIAGKKSEVPHGTEFAKVRRDFWRYVGNVIYAGK